MSTLRSLEFGVLTLAGIPAYIFCEVAHLCMAGHMHHPPYPAWHFAVDLWWLATFLCAASTVLRSELSLRYVSAIVLVVLVISRVSVVLGSGESAFLVFETPLALFLAVIAVCAIRQHRKSVRLLLPTDAA